jgi:hypothetical protein
MNGLSQESEWRTTLIEIERARRDYEALLESHESNERAIGRLWLRLWRAERRRDELLRSVE